MWLPGMRICSGVLWLLHWCKMRFDAAAGSLLTPYAQWSSDYGWVLHARAVMAEPNTGPPPITILNRLGIQVIAFKAPEC